MTRLLNLVYIVLTQALFHYCVAIPISAKSNIPFVISDAMFWLIVLASVLIAAAGYIINDYFDLNIDSINKPKKVVIDTMISRRWALFFHMSFSMAGVLISFYIGWHFGTMSIAFANMACVMLLWFYSTAFKKKLLSGNTLISILTAWVIMVLYVATIDKSSFQLSSIDRSAFQKFTRISILYAAFAFIVSVIREVIKDVEDMEGDAKYGCKTMPIVWGVNVSKVFAAVWIIVLVCSLLIVQLYVLIQFGWWHSALYCVLFIITPLFVILFRLRKAYTAAEFHSLSSLTKFVMLTGVLSMLFLRYLL